jgi:P-loop Domain of unknown function (DUF2791)
MIGEFVEHPQYGRGQVVALFRNGTEWMVRFASGLRFRRPRQEFNGQQERVMSGISSGNPLGALPSVYEATVAPMPRTQLEARQLIEALRVGIAPAQHVRELTVGLVAERATLGSGLNKAHQTGGAVRAVVGDYGFGKSHIVELTAQEALTRNFLVAATSLDLLELPAHRSFDIYSSLLRNLRYPNNDERGLGPLLEAAANHTRLRQQLQEITTVSPDPLTLTVEAMNGTTSSRQRQAWLEWLISGRKAKTMGNPLPKGVKFPTLYRAGNNDRQIAYLLSGLSVLARLLGYSGLCLLIDEAESYSLLRPKQRAQADRFFSAVIYAALRDTQAHIEGDAIPQHHFRDYPLTYGGKQSLFFLFTTTHSDNAMPLEDWLDDDQIIELNPHHTPQEIGQFLQQMMGYHAQAYGYEADERQGQIRRGAAEHLALGMRNNALSIREVVRLGVELFDLLYQYPDYSAAALLDELREQTR